MFLFLHIAGTAADLQGPPNDLSGSGATRMQAAADSAGLPHWASAEPVVHDEAEAPREAEGVDAPLPNGAADPVIPWTPVDVVEMLQHNARMWEAGIRLPGWLHVNAQRVPSAIMSLGYGLSYNIPIICVPSRGAVFACRQP